VTTPENDYAPTRDDCYTPRWVFDAMDLRFDLDVAAPPGGPWYVPCERYYTAEDDGLTSPWDGLVWCNPPFSKFRPWAERWAAHDGSGVLMGMTSARSMGRALGLWGADAVAFIDVKFERPDQPLRDVPTAIFVAFRGVGVEPAERLAAADPRGAVLYGRKAA
jgi:phage N-6-adenine-methyltransferase